MECTLEREKAAQHAEAAADELEKLKEASMTRR